MNTRGSLRQYVASVLTGVSQDPGCQLGLLVWRPPYKTPSSSSLSWRGIFRKQLLALSGLSSPSKVIPLWFPPSLRMRPNRTPTQTADTIPILLPFLNANNSHPPPPPQDVLDLREKTSWDHRWTLVSSSISYSVATAPLESIPVPAAAF